MAPEPHIPAWKRLGLKLKYAADDETPGSEAFDTGYGKKRRLEDDGASIKNEVSQLIAANPAKKVKTRSSASGVNTFGSPINVNTGKGANTSAYGRLNGAPLATMPQLQSQKNVTFTADTKVADGAGMKDLYQSWVKAQEGPGDKQGSDQREDHNGQQEVAQDQVPLDDANREDEVNNLTAKGKGRELGRQPAIKDVTAQDANIDNDTPQSAASKGEKGEKKKKKKKGKKKSQTTLLHSLPQPSNSVTQPSSSSSPSFSSKTSEPPETAALTYLHTFQTSLSTWKFSKNHQTHLLKNVLSLAKIPPQHNSALFSYLKGLKGHSAKAELRRRAHEAREADRSWESATQNSGGDADNEDDDVMKIDQESQQSFKSAWQHDLKGVLATTAPISDEPGTNGAQTVPPPSSPQPAQQQNPTADLTWRVARRVRAETILAAIGHQASSSSPSPERGSKSAIAASAPPSPSPPRHRHAAVETNGVDKISNMPKHVKFHDNDDDGDDDRDRDSNNVEVHGSSSRSISTTTTTTTSRDGAASHHANTVLPTPASAMKAGKKTQPGDDGKMRRPVPQPPAQQKGNTTKDGGKTKPTKKRKRKRKSRARTAVSSGSDSDSDSDSESSSSSDDSL